MPEVLPAITLNFAKKILQDIGEPFPDRDTKSQAVFDHQDFTNKVFRRTSYDRCKFFGRDFTQAAGTGAKWTGSEFRGCLFDGTDMEFADFSDTIFGLDETGIPTRVLGSGFNAIIARNATFSGLIVIGSSFAQSDFSNAKISNCNISSSTLEGCLFESCQIDTVSFANANVEYADFSNANLKNTFLPLMQLPFVFGVDVEQLKRGDVVVSSDERSLTYDEFENIIPSLIKVMSSHNEYFGIANLAYMFNNIELFQSSMQTGMAQAAMHANFRELKYLCKLASLGATKKNLLPRGILKKLYDGVISSVNGVNDLGMIQQYSLHDGQIRSYLLETEHDQLTISFTTTTDNSIKAQTYVAEVSQAIQDACQLVGIDIQFQHLNLSTYSNAQSQLKTSYVKMTLPFGMSYEKTQTFEVEQTKNKNPWNSQTIYMACIATTVLLFTGVIHGPALFERIGDNHIFQQKLEEKKPEILKIHNQIKHYVEPNSLSFCQGIQQLAHLSNDTLYLDQPNVNKQVDISKLENPS